MVETLLNQNPILVKLQLALIRMANLIDTPTDFLNCTGTFLSILRGHASSIGFTILAPNTRLFNV